jgi:uncharacterized protein
MQYPFDPTHTPPSAEVSGEPETAAREEQPTTTPKPRRPRGFAAMDRSRVSEIASKGGRAAHAAGTAHQFTSDEARAAGKKGGVAPHVRRGRGPRTVTSQTAPPNDPNEGAQSE